MEIGRDRFSELNGFIQLPALRTTRAVHIRIIRVNLAATLTPKNTIGAGRGVEAPFAQLGVYSQPAERAEQDHDVEQN